MYELVLMNLEKVMLGALIFLGAYISNVMLGAWKSVKIDGSTFDWKMILNSAIKYAVLTIGIAILAIVVAVVPEYATYIGITIEDATLQAIDSIVIIGAFLTSAIRYLVDAVNKVKTILGIGITSDK